MFKALIHSIKALLVQSTVCTNGCTKLKKLPGSYRQEQLSFFMPCK